jgi:parvulin-like peptidyl-prolyl isomerase
MLPGSSPRTKLGPVCFTRKRGPHTELLTHSKGGALGWKKRGDLDLAFEEAAFALEASTTANPTYVDVKTGFGYHIIMVEGRK